MRVILDVNHATRFYIKKTKEGYQLCSSILPKENFLDDTASGVLWDYLSLLEKEVEALQEDRANLDTVRRILTK